MRERRDLLEVSVLQVADEVVRLNVHRLAPREDVAAIVVQQLERALVVRRFRAEQPGCLSRLEIEAIDERPVPLGRCPGSHEEDRAAPVRGPDHIAAELVRLHHRVAWIRVSILQRAFLEQHGLGARVARLDLPHAQLPGLPPELAQHREFARPPGDPAVAISERRQLDRVSLEGDVLHEDLVPDLRFDSCVSPVLGLRPSERGGSVGSPAETARARLNAPERDRDLLLEGDVDDRVHRSGLEVTDLDELREARRGNAVRVRTVNPMHEQVSTVRRRAEVPGDPGLRDRFQGAVERHAGQLHREVMVEQGLVVRALEKVLVRTGRGLPAKAFLDDRAGGHARLHRLGPATLGHERGDQRLAVGEPGGCVAGREAEVGTGQSTSSGALHIQHPKLDSLCRRIGERNAGPVG